MKRNRRHAALSLAIVLPCLAIATTPAEGSVIHFQFTSGSLAGDLAFTETPFVPFINPGTGTFDTTATLTFGPIGQDETTSIPLQDLHISIENDLDVSGTRAYRFFDQLRLSSSGPFASYEFFFTQRFNPPGTGFLSSLSLSTPVPVFFPIVCPSGTIPCQDGAAPLGSGGSGGSGTTYNWTFNGNRRDITSIVAIVEPTPVPEPGLAVLTGAATLVALLPSRRLRTRRQA